MTKKNNDFKEVKGFANLASGVSNRRAASFEKLSASEPFRTHVDRMEAKHGAVEKAPDGEASS